MTQLQTPAATVACPITEQPTQVTLLDDSRRPWRLVQCQQTGFVFLENPPNYSQLAEEFAWEKSGKEKRKRQVAEQPIATHISTFLKRLKHFVFPRRNKFLALAHAVIEPQDTLSLLDVGCGSGHMVSALCEHYQRLGSEVVPFGVEISEQLATVAQEQFACAGGDVARLPATDGVAQFAPEQFDAVLMCSFLEHEAQPLTLLNLTHRALKPSGVVIIKVPNYASWNRRVRGRKWCAFRYPDHVNYFTPATLRAVAREAGFRVARQFPLDALPWSDSMYMVLKKSATSAPASTTAPITAPAAPTTRAAA